MNKHECPTCGSRMCEDKMTPLEVAKREILHEKHLAAVALKKRRIKASLVVPPNGAIHYKNRKKEKQCLTQKK